MPVTPDPVITAINRYRAASAELDKIAIREPTLPNGNPADETEEYAVWETARHQAQDVAATACAEVIATQPTTVAGAIALINCYLEIWSEHPIRAEHQASGALKVLRSFLRSIAEQGVPTRLAGGKRSRIDSGNFHLLSTALWPSE